MEFRKEHTLTTKTVRATLNLEKKTKSVLD